MPNVDGSATDVIMLLRLACAPPDQAAWEAFVKRYGPRIRAWCRAWRLQEAGAQDVTQAVLIKLVLSLRQFTYDPSQSFRGWLRKSVKRVCSGCTTRRRRSLGVVAPNGNDGLDPIEAVAARNDLGRPLEAE